MKINVAIWIPCTASQACTLICLITAQLLGNRDFHIWDAEKCKELNIIIARAIIKGNAIHAKIVEEGLISHVYLNVEEALRYGGNYVDGLKEWEFQVFRDNMQLYLYENIKHFLKKWKENVKPKNLYMLLIAGGRSVLFVFSFQDGNGLITFFDSHRHSVKTLKSESLKGLVVAQTVLQHLDLLCEWFLDNILGWEVQVSQYELSFLYHKGSPTNPSICTCENSRSLKRTTKPLPIRKTTTQKNYQKTTNNKK